MERNLENKPRFDINPDSGALIKAFNKTVEAKIRGGENHVRAVQMLAQLAADSPNAIEILSAIKEKTKLHLEVKFDILKTHGK